MLTITLICDEAGHFARLAHLTASRMRSSIIHLLNAGKNGNSPSATSFIERPYKHDGLHGVGFQSAPCNVLGSSDLYCWCIEQSVQETSRSTHARL